MAKDIMKTVMILAVIAVVAGILLGVVNSFTQVSEEEQLKKKLTLVYDKPDQLERVELSGASIEPINDQEITSQGEILDVFKAPDGSYIIRALGKGGYGGDVQLLYRIKDSKIEKIAVYSHTETPGLGAKGFEDEYLQNFYNKDISNIDKFTVVKTAPSDDSEIKAITGATYTSNAVKNATNIAALWYNLNADEEEQS